jgi:hypothetical protein
MFGKYTKNDAKTDKHGAIRTAADFAVSLFATLRRRLLLPSRSPQKIEA